MIEPIVIEPIKIDEGGRYLIVFKPTRRLSAAATERFLLCCKDVSQRINDWWKTGEKFCMVAVDDTVSVAVERVDAGISKAGAIEN